MPEPQHTFPWSADELRTIAANVRHTDDTREWARRSLFTALPEDAKDDVKRWLESKDLTEQAYAVSLIGRLRLKEYWEQLSALYRDSNTQILRELLPGVMKALDEEQYLNLLKERLELGKPVDPADLGMLAMLVVKYPTPENYRLLLNNHSSVYERQFDLDVFSEVQTALLGLSAYADYKNILLEMLVSGVKRSGQGEENGVSVNYSRAQGGVLRAFKADRLANQFLPTGNVFTDYANDYVGKMVMAYPMLAEIFTEERVAQLSDSTKNNRFGEVFDVFLRASQDQLERLNLGDYEIPEPIDGEAHPEVPLALGVNRYLSGLEEAMKQVDGETLDPVYIGTMAVQFAHLLSAAELVAERPDVLKPLSPESTARLGVAERLELAEHPMRPHSELDELLKLPETKELDGKDFDVIQERLHSDRAELSVHAVQLVESKPSETAFLLVWERLSKASSRTLFQAIQRLLLKWAESEFSVDLFEWLSKAIARLQGDQVSVLLAMCKLPTTAAARFAVEHASLIYRLNRWVLFQAAEVSRIAEWRDALRPFAGEYERDFNQLIIDIDDLNGGTYEHRPLVETWVRQANEREKRLFTPLEGQQEIDAVMLKTPLTAECHCLACNHAFTYPVMELFVDVEELQQQSPTERGERPDPFFIRDTLRCRNCGVENRMLLTEKGRDSILEGFYQSGGKDCLFQRRLKAFRLVTYRDRKMNPRQAAQVALADLKKQPGNLETVQMVHALHGFLGEWKENLAALQHVRSYHTQQNGFFAMQAETLEHLDRKEEAFESLAQAIRLLYNAFASPGENSSRPAIGKDAQAQAKLMYNGLWRLGRAIDKPDDVEAVLNEAPASGLFPNAQRNDKCPCGSGRKFKQCCLKR